MVAYMKTVKLIGDFYVNIIQQIYVAYNTQSLIIKLIRNNFDNFSYIKDNGKHYSN